MAKDRKYGHHRSKGERMNWSPVSRESKAVVHNPMTGRFLTAVATRDRNGVVVRTGVKQLVP